MYQVIKVSSDLGAPIAGTGAGPERIALALQESYPSLLHNSITVPIPEESSGDNREGGSTPVNNLDVVKSICVSVASSVSKVLKSGNVPLVLHGDDSTVIGIGFGISNSLKEPFGIVYFDAHGDINTPETSPSNCLWGMPLAHLLGYGNQALLELNAGNSPVEAKNLVLIGQRNLDSGEAEFIRQKEIALYSPLKVKQDLQKVLEEIKKKFAANGVKKIYIHFDQDAIDPLESGASLAQEPNGLSQSDLYKIAEFLKNEFDIAAISIGNYLPHIDKNQKTLAVIFSFFEKLGVISNWVLEIEALQEKMLADFRSRPREGVKTHFLNKDFILYKNVFWLEDASSPVVENLIIKKGESVLEVCTGSGVLAIFAAHMGAEKVVATDISYDAVRCAKANVALHKFDKLIDVRLGDLFNEVSEKFDVVIANLPYREKGYSDTVEMSIWDANLDLHRRFYENVGKYLKENGRIYVGQANFGAVEEMKQMAEKAGFKLKKIGEHVTPGDPRVFYAFELTR